MVRKYEPIEDGLNKYTMQKIDADFRYLYNTLGEVNTIIDRSNSVLNEAQRVNAENEDVQKQIDDLIINSGQSDAEVVQARGDFDILKERFEDIESKRADFNFNSNNTQPAKKGTHENHYKLIRKVNADNLEVYQKAPGGYVRYVFTRNLGGTGYGVNYELLRVTNVKPMSDVVVFSRIDLPVVGSVTRTWDFADNYNTTMIRYFLDGYKATFDSGADYHMNGALTPHTIPAGASVTYSVDKPVNNKINVMFFHRANYSGNNDKVNVYVNDRLATTITIDDSFSQTVKRFDIPVYERNTNANNPLNVKFENTSVNEVYIVGLNVYKLSEYEGQGYDSFLAVGSTLNPFISNTGSSDYAFTNAENGKQFGSYHGGEVSMRCDILWRSGISDRSSYVPYDTIGVSEFCVLKNLSFKQTTVLIERAYMHTKTNFDVDGTLQQDFSYEMFNGANIPFIDFWSALTCTDPNFSIVRMPFYSNGEGKTGHLYFRATDGYVVQETQDALQELHSRFTRFNNEFIGTEQANSISRQAGYHKHYYAPIRNWQDAGSPVAPGLMQFSKGLDFYIY